ncbi:UDP-N-acetyl glucosamine 2-epimerase [Candidatus Bipolaricaulota bacterium]
MIEQLERIFVDRPPDVVLVYGDTNSTLAAALAAAKLHIPVAHVEAGLRSFNKAMPEEINRVLTDHVSTILFCPTRQSVANARVEGFSNAMLDGALVPMTVDAPPQSLSPSADNPLVLNVGDVMYDIYLSLAAQSSAESSIIQRLDLKASDYALATIHRAENTDDLDRLRGIVEGLSTLAADGLRIVLPAHPRTRKALLLLAEQNDCSALEIIDPIGYLDMLAVERNAAVILTDSGGVQKEAFFSGVPCITLRDETEWVELVEAGWNQLAGAEPARIRDAAQSALAFDRANPKTSLYGDGHASERIVRVLKDVWQRVQT